ncbi:hypothetical protein PBV87_13240 [Niameybacter massiliensis]|uniref:Uncharacterized protein n=1 Tax=Holtiella tumoricola TaxID=3018743 RepID=A0AA42J1S2_9FIRM|nr:hypothetical protein [Holtiella tumoricola]MDA3732451.1 hypothetical protein [Holtiella tumoricola]
MQNKELIKRPLKIKKDLTGEKYGRLQVIDVDYQKGGYTYYRCQCECGRRKTVRGTSLKAGAVKSCGCLQIKAGRNRKKHGLCKHPLYSVWSAMKSRCEDKSNIYYGGRGIKVADEWLEFEYFYHWCMRNGYKQGLSLDRIDTDGHYTPANCRFITLAEQNKNKRNNRQYEYQGEPMLIKEISEKTRIPIATLWHHLSKGKKVEDVIQHYSPYIKPIKDKSQYEQIRKKLLEIWNLNKELRILTKRELAVAMLKEYPRCMVASVTEKSYATLYRDCKRLIENN